MQLAIASFWLCREHGLYTDTDGPSDEGFRQFVEMQEELEGRSGSGISDSDSESDDAEHGTDDDDEGYCRNHGSI
jgi:hypothetical protein